MAFLPAVPLLGQLMWGYRQRQKALLAFLGLLFSYSFWIAMPFSVAQTPTEIYWDSWGVPHIFAPTEEKLFQAFGWAQAHAHSSLLLQLYGEARGRASEYIGIEGLNNDQYVRLMGIPKRAKTWYQSQIPAIKADLDAFAQGINDYLKAHPQKIPPAYLAVLPITAVDVLALTQRILWFEFLVTPQQVEALKQQRPLTPSPAGSNAWAIAPTRSQTGKALLLANPHTPWGGVFRWTEAHLQAPGFNLSGAALVGTPMLAMGFNDYLGWSLTVNDPHSVGQYQLTRQGEGYVWDGEVKPFQTETEYLKIRRQDGGFQTLEWDYQNSEAGIIVAQQPEWAYALHIPGLERSQVVTQFLQMGKAKNQEEFQRAWQALQVPLFNVLYADGVGNIAYLYNALVPKGKETWRERGQIQTITSSADLPQDYWSYNALPQLKNPDSGWLQNSNDPPWTSTFPSQLHAQDYAPALAAPDLTEASNLLRTQRSLKMLLGKNKWSLDSVIQQKFSSQLELADRLLPLLIPAARMLANPLGQEAAEVLNQWDRQANASSRGMVLFQFWASTLGAQKLFSKPWDSANPLNTPTGIADINTALAVLEGVAAQVQLLYGALDVSWGDVAYMRAGSQQLPAQGGPGELGSFRVLKFFTTPQQRFQAWFGDSFIQVVEFSQPPRAQSLLVYGNSSQPDSVHNGDQLSLYSQNRLHPVWRSKEEILSHLVKKEVPL